MRKGLVISFEGLDKCGKETQADYLKKFLERQGIVFASGREPGGTSYGEIERRSLQDPFFIARVNTGYKTIKGIPQLSSKEDLTPVAEIFGYLKARAQFFQLKVKPVVDHGGLFVLDRTGDSTVAYQGFGLYEGKKSVVDLIRKNNRFAMGEVRIHRTYFLDISVEEMLNRQDHGEFGSAKDRIEQRKKEFFERARRGYYWLARQEPHRYKVIDGTLPREAIASIIQNDMMHLIVGWRQQANLL